MARIAGAIAAPALLSGCLYSCRRKTKVAGRPSPLIGDDVEEAASFRPALPTSEPSIRVRVLKPRGAATCSAGLRIGAADQWLRVYSAGSSGRGLALRGPVHVALMQSGWSVVDQNGMRPVVDPQLPLEVSLIDAPDGLMPVVELAVENIATSKQTTRMYAGLLRLVRRNDLAGSAADQVSALMQDIGFDVINELPIEKYLPGVLAGELYKTWHLETHAAQAVAARSFACTEAAVFAGRRHYDVSNTASSQMYIGGGTHDKSQEAVAMTRGLMLGYEGLLVSGYYSSCCGGAAATAIDAIGSNPVNDVAPLQGRSGTDVCTEASVFKWSVQQPIELLSRRIVAYGQEKRDKALVGLTRLASIDVSATNGNGRATRIRIVDDRENAVELGAEEFRRAANYYGQGLHPPQKPLRSSHLRASFTSSTVTFDGYGFGHGVGLCQYGSEILAKSGSRHREILQWYYPGVELTQAYV